MCVCVGRVFKEGGEVFDIHIKQYSYVRVLTTSFQKPIRVSNPNSVSINRDSVFLQCGKKREMPKQRSCVR